MINYNGTVYQGNNIRVVNGKVYIDGKLANESDSDKKIVNINLTLQVECDVHIDCASTVQIYGSANKISTGAGDIEVMGDVKNVETGSGDVTFETLVEGGSVKTGAGDIKYKKIRSK